MSEKVKLVATVLKQEYVWEPELSGSALAIEAARKGYQEWLQDAASTAKPNDTEEKDPRAVLDTTDPRYKEFIAPIRERAVKERNAKIKAGTYTPGAGGGRGSSLTAEERGWISWVNKATDVRGPKKAQINGQTLAEAQMTLCTRELLRQGVVKEQVVEKAKANLAAWVAWMEANDAALMAAIAAERALDGATAPTSGFKAV